ncbi:sensor histidine kinase [Salinihabitans flavidus]|uniref:sensor histidine kinase n=1 Tax=Salinihabitans flavidus TaxID=569882 RepID=UPI0011144B68|nr:sensor histidine kinase [Salinihabitans flavidus]
MAGTLTIAMLPIGAIAIAQAVEISREEARRKETVLLTATAEAAIGEALAIASARGAASTLTAEIIRRGGSATADCSAMFESVVRENLQFSFAGYASAGGKIVCGSSALGQDIREGVVYKAMEVDKKPTVVANRKGIIGGHSVIVVAAPVFVGTKYQGFVAISVPHTRIHKIIGGTPSDRPLDIVTFNAAGAVLSSDAGQDALSRELPAGRSLSSLISMHQYAFSGHTQAGEKRTFAVVPIFPGVAYALGSWNADPTMGWARLSTVVFPALMLIVGLVVAFTTVNRTVIRRISRLKTNMSEFALSRRIEPITRKRQLPREFREIDTVWVKLAEKLVRDEAELEEMVRQKNVLLKEVHHRVKNNLQLIASIVNLKFRRATSDEARRSLSEVRMRVSSIATVHQALYTNNFTGKVRADELLAEVIDATITAGSSGVGEIQVSQSYDRILLYPDQAVPFLLLASEAVTNALKYIGRPAEGPPMLSVTLSDPGGGHAEFRVFNSVGVPLLPPAQVQGSGLGRSLIAGFSKQIGGEVQTVQTDEAYDFCLTFTPAPFDPEIQPITLNDIDGDQ